MAQVIRETRVVERGDNGLASESGFSRTSLTIARIIYFVSGLLTTLLAVRFILALLGANLNNAFADFIYTVSYPFVAPFAGLFNYRTQYGASRFEIETLVAIIVYGIVAWGIVKLLTIRGTDYDNDAEV